MTEEPLEAAVSVRVRLYLVRFKRPRGVFHDGTRWRRIPEPWDIESSREVRTTRALREMGWKDAPFPPYDHTLTAPGIGTVRISEYVEVR